MFDFNTFIATAATATGAAKVAWPFVKPVLTELAKGSFEDLVKDADVQRLMNFHAGRISL